MKAKLHLTPDSSNTTVPLMENSFKPLPSEDTFYPMTSQSDSCALVMKENQSDVVALQSEHHEYQMQNELLRKEVQSLQYDNTVLLTQLTDQVMCLSALTFDAERYKTKLEQEHIPVPASTFDQVRQITKIPRSCISPGINLPQDLLNAAVLSSDELVSFTSVTNLVTCVNELQVRLRESHLRREFSSKSRLEELENCIGSIEEKLLEVQKSREILKKRYEEDLLLMTRKKDAALGRLSALELETSNLRKQLEEKKRQEECDIQKMNLQKVESHIQSLQDLVEKKTNEIALLRTELNSVSSCSFIAQKENEYHEMAWKREKSNNEELRQERQRLTEELTATKGRTVALETDLMLLKGKHEVMERLVEAKDFEISQWKKRVNDLKEQHDEEEKSWEKSLKDGVARLNETDLQYDLAQDQITTLEKRLCENEQKFATTLAEKDLLISTLTGRFKKNQVLLEEEIAAHTLCKKHATDLSVSLKAQREERQCLVDRIELVEKQAILLQNRYPTLNFEVLEEEVRCFEKEKQNLLAQVVTLQEEKKNLTDLLQEEEKKYQDVTGRLNISAEHVLQVERELQVELDKVKTLTEKCETQEKKMEELQSELEGTKQSLKSVSSQLEKQISDYQALQASYNDQKSQYTALYDLHETEQKDMQYQLKIGTLDKENAQQLYRLEVQAHGQDIEKLNSLNDKVQELTISFEKTVEEEKEIASKLREEIAVLKKTVEEYRYRLDLSHSEKEIIQADNNILRELVTTKLDALELEGEDSLKCQLAMRIKCEDTLKRNLHHARTECEKLKQEVNSLQNSLQTMRRKEEEETQTILKLEKEIERFKQKETNTSLCFSPQEHEYSLLQLRFNRLTNDYNYQQELRRNLEKQLNEILAEYEPTRRQKAELCGEVLGLKTALNNAEKDAALYKDKYFQAVKLHDTNIIQIKEDLTFQLNQVKEQNESLQKSLTNVTEECHQKEFKEKELTEKCSTLVSALQQQTDRIQNMERHIEIFKQTPTNPMLHHADVPQLAKYSKKPLQVIKERIISFVPCTESQHKSTILSNATPHVITNLSTLPEEEVHQIQYLMDHSIRLSVIVALLLTTLKPNLSRISLPEKEMILQCTQFIASTTPNLQTPSQDTRLATLSENQCHFEEDIVLDTKSSQSPSQTNNQ